MKIQAGDRDGSLGTLNQIRSRHVKIVVTSLSRFRQVYVHSVLFCFASPKLVASVKTPKTKDKDLSSLAQFDLVTCATAREMWVSTPVRQ